MKTKHTPGPWMFDATLKGDGSFGGSYIVSNNAKKTWPLAEVYREDNARLIAAAPELLEALKAMVAIWEGPRELAALRFAKSVIDARAAIAKATGE